MELERIVGMYAPAWDDMGAVAFEAPRIEVLGVNVPVNS
jgi:hypothetical protein